MKSDKALAAFIRQVFLQRAKDDDFAAATICDFPLSEMDRAPDIPNFADWLEENSARITPGGEAEKAASEVNVFCADWLKKTSFTRSD